MHTRPMSTVAKPLIKLTKCLYTGYLTKLAIHRAGIFFLNARFYFLSPLGLRLGLVLVRVRVSFGHKYRRNSPVPT